MLERILAFAIVVGAIFTIATVFGSPEPLAPPIEEEPPPKAAPPPKGEGKGADRDKDRDEEKEKDKGKKKKDPRKKWRKPRGDDHD